MPSRVLPAILAAGVTNASISPWVDSEILRKIILPLLMIWLMIRVEHTTRKTEQKARAK